MNTTATHCNHNPALGSILKRSPAAPAEKVKCAAALVFGEDLGRFAGRLGRTRNHLSQVINGSRRDSAALRRDIAQTFGVAEEDIWPADLAAQTNHDPSLAQPSTSGNWNSGAEI